MTTFVTVPGVAGRVARVAQLMAQARVLVGLGEDAVHDLRTELLHDIDAVDRDVLSAVPSATDLGGGAAFPRDLLLSCVNFLYALDDLRAETE